MMTNAVGVLKEEMRLLGSLIIEAAYACEVPAGSALAVDRYRFSDYITEKLRSHPLIEIEERELTEIPDGIVVVATGPLTSDSRHAISPASSAPITSTSTTPPRR